MVTIDDELHRQYRELKALSNAAREARIEVMRRTDPEHARRLEEYFEDDPISTGAAQQIFSAVDIPVPPPKAIADFTELEPLGAGGQGRVFQARQKVTERIVAVKLFAPSSIPPAGERFERYLREARILGLLEHPNIARVISANVEQVDGVHWPYIAMELVEHGRDLVEYAKSAKLGLADRIRLLREVCGAIAYAHEQQVIHRDLKPANVLVDRYGRVRVVDFGIAALPSADPRRNKLTRTNEVLGTPTYMSPEQADPKKPVDHRADIYALGTIAYELFSGDVPLRASPFHSGDTRRVLEWSDPTPLHRKIPGFSVKLSNVVDTALRKDPVDRYQTVADFAQNLQLAYDDGDCWTKPLPLPMRIARWGWSHKAVSAAVILAVATTISTALYVITELRSQRQQLEASASRELENARAFKGTGDWERAEVALRSVEAIGYADPIEIELEWIDVLEGQCQTSKERAKIAALEARLPELKPAQRARVLLLAGDHTREPEYRMRSDVGREKIVAALDSGNLGHSDTEYAEALLAESPIEQGDRLQKASELDPGNRRAFEMLVPTLLFSGRSSEAATTALHFRGRFPNDPCSGLAELATRCIIGGEAIDAIRGEYSEIPEEAIAELRLLLEFRKLYAGYARQLAKVAYLRPLDRERSVALHKQIKNDLVGPLVVLPASKPTSSVEPLYRLPPRLAETWSKVALAGFSSSLLGLSNRKLETDLDDVMRTNPDGVFRILRGNLESDKGSFASASKFYSEAAAAESLLDVATAASLFALVSARGANDLSDKARIESEVARLLAREDLDGDEYRFLSDTANWISEVELMREIAWQWRRRWPDDPDADATIAWIDYSEGNYASARKHMEFALRDDPKNERALWVKKQLEK